MIIQDLPHVPDDGLAEVNHRLYLEFAAGLADCRDRQVRDNQDGHQPQIAPRQPIVHRLADHGRAKDRVKDRGSHQDKAEDQLAPVRLHKPEQPPRDIAIVLINRRVHHRPYNVWPFI